MLRVLANSSGAGYADAAAVTSQWPGLPGGWLGCPGGGPGLCEGGGDDGAGESGDEGDAGDESSGAGAMVSETLARSVPRPEPAETLSVTW
jgi:hypothetical protein